MRILVDIGHPAHVHYFKNFINISLQNDNIVIVTARKRDVIFDLLQAYNISYFNRGRGKNSKIGKLLYLFYATHLLTKLGKKYKIDIFLSFSSPYAALASKLLGKPHICLNDTEHTDKIHSRFTYPYSDSIITPQSYQHDLGVQHIRFQAVVEYFYLHPAFYTLDKTIYDLLKLKVDEKFVLLRFVAWTAHHDYNQSGLSYEQKIKLVEYLAKNKFKVFISAEGPLEPIFLEYAIHIPPERMHDVLSIASLFIGESGTMASESALLGTQAIYINSLPIMCYLKLEQDAGLLYHLQSATDLFPTLETVIKNDIDKSVVEEKKKNFVQDFINPTEFLVWFVENYPNSHTIMIENTNFQKQFKNES